MMFLEWMFISMSAVQPHRGGSPGGGGGGGGAGGAPAAVGRRGVHVVRFVYCVCVFLYRADGGEKVS